jgi:hypothetical protein
MVTKGGKTVLCRIDMHVERGVTKRCRLSWLTNSALVYEPKGGGGGGGAGSQTKSEPTFNLFFRAKHIRVIAYLETLKHMLQTKSTAERMEPK